MKSDTSTHLVVGHRGEVGGAIFDLLNDHYKVSGVDLEHTNLPYGRDKVSYLHVCIGYSSAFQEIVKSYIREWLLSEGLCIIHSTVPLGISRTLGAVHSPIRGVHPQLLDCLRVFVKYFGGNRAEEAAGIFNAIGVTTKITPRSEDTEALKLWDTTYYGWNIVFNKAVKEYCDAHGLDFNVVYTDANRTYNEGYSRIGRDEVLRPVLRHMKGGIGGHCIVPNCELLGHEVSEIIRKFHDRLLEEENVSAADLRKEESHPGSFLKVD